MLRSLLRPGLVSPAVIFLAGCATTESGETISDPASPGAAVAEVRAEAPRERVTATEAAVAERRSSSPSSGARESSGNAPTETAKLVDQLNEAARELATLRTANAKLRTERPRPAATATEAGVKVDPADERLAASLKTFTQFKQEMAAVLAEIDRLKRSNADLSAEMKSGAEQTKLAAEQTRQAKAAMQRVEDDLRTEKRSRLEAETTVTQLREQLRTIARAMSGAGLSAEKLSAQAEGGETRGKSGARPPTRYVVRAGDTLEKIADRMYGDAGKWRVILDANRGRVGVDRALETGMEIEIPRN